MKKFLTILLAAMLSMTGFAQDYDEIGIVPTQLTAGETGSITLTLNNPSIDNVRAMGFTLVYPEGWTNIAKDSQNFGERAPKDAFGNTGMTITGNNIPGHNQITYIIYSKTDKGLSGNSGDVVTIQLIVPKDTPAGYYPFTIEGTVIANAPTSSSTNIQIGTTTSYVKVGEPQQATLALSGIVPTFVNEALANEPATALGTLDLTQATAINGTFHYVDARDVTIPSTKSLTASTVMYKRTVAEGKYSAIQLPFDAQFNHYTFNRVNDDYAIFEENTAYQSGTPALVKGTVEAQAENVVLSSVSTQNITEGWYVKDNKFLHVNGYAVIPALRGYFPQSLVGGGTGTALRIAIGSGKPTGIGSILDEDHHDTYDLHGRRIANPQRGTYIQDGQKTIK